MPLKVYKNVPKDEVGECVQLHVDAGAIRVIVEPDAGGLTCTVTVES